jgi:hypothetical protein
MLMPAAVLVLAVLASLAVDAGVAFLGQRQLADAAAGAANDAAVALDDRAFYDGAPPRLDAARAADVAAASLAATAPHGFVLLGPPVVEVDGTQVCVALSARVDRVIAAAVPGAARSVVVHARAAATATDGAVPPRRSSCWST